MFSRLKSQAHWALIPITISLVLAFMLSIGNLFALLLMTIATSATFFYLRFKQLDRMQVKLAEPESSTLEVWASTGNIGTITEAKYASLELEMSSDARLFFRQTSNVIGVVWRISYNLVLALPAVMFWVILTMGIVDPEAVAASARSLATMTAADVSNLLNFVITLFIMMPVLTFGLSVIFGWPFGAIGFVNYYSQERSSRLLSHCGASAAVDANVRSPKTATATATTSSEA